MREIKVDIYSHFFKIEDLEEQYQPIISSFVKDNLLEIKTEFENGRVRQVPGMVFATRSSDHREFRFHIGTWDKFKTDMDMRKIDLKIVDHRETVHVGVEASFKTPKGKELRDYQKEIIEKLEQSKTSTFMIELAMGLGKTTLALFYAARYQRRVCIFVLGRYTDRWWGDLEFYAKRDEILEIRGSKELLRTLEFCGTEIFESTKIIIMTLDTFNDYCRDWERMTHEERKNNVPPEDIWEILGVGLRITDEVHQHFYKNFLIDLYTHLPKTIYLSATLKPESRFVEAMTRVMFPMECRAGKGLQKKYTNVTAVFHGTNEPWKLKYKNGKGMYSHTRYEKYLMSNKKVCANYYGLVDKIVKEDYVDKKDKGQKMLIFFATKAMCDDYAKHLKKTFPKLDSRRYISEDKYENLLKADIACSTLGSSGTAVDIPNLKIALMTTALKSEQANLQALGRTREIPGVQTEFKYFVNTSIDKHKQYHYDKVKLFRDWAKEQKVQMSDVFI